MKTSNILLGSILLALSATGSVQAALLSDLMGGGSLSVGDKTFDQFTAFYSVNSSSTAPDQSFNFDWSKISVDTIDDGGNYGLNFTLDQGALSAFADSQTPFDFSDVFFGFHVSATSPYVINGVSLNAAGTASGTGNYGVFEYVGNSFDEVKSKADLGDYSAKVDSTGLDNAFSAALTGSSDYYVGKNLIVSAYADDAGADGDASLISFEQRFNQTKVPEPSMLMLLGAGLMGFFFNSKRRS